MPSPAPPPSSPPPTPRPSPASLPTTARARAGLVFPVSHTRQEMEESASQSVTTPASAVLECITAEILELADGGMRREKKRKIKEYQVVHAVRDDPELSELVGHLLPSTEAPDAKMEMDPEQVEQARNEDEELVNVLGQLGLS